MTIVLGRMQQPNDVDALTCEQLDVKFHMGEASMELENLFGGNNDLGKNKLINIISAYLMSPSPNLRRNLD